jgi:tetratricopeptide (TPR) repeat protein
LFLDARSAEAAISGARVLTKLDRTDEAIRLLNQFLQVDPDHVEGLSELALLLVTIDQPTLRNPAQGFALAERACQLSDRRSSLPLRALAAGQAAVGRFDEAIATASEALAIVKASPNSAEDVTDRIEAELSTYRKLAASTDPDR